VKLLNPSICALASAQERGRSRSHGGDRSKRAHRRTSSPIASSRSGEGPAHHGRPRLLIGEGAEIGTPRPLPRRMAGGGRAEAVVQWPGNAGISRLTLTTEVEARYRYTRSTGRKTPVPRLTARVFDTLRMISISATRSCCAGKTRSIIKTRVAIEATPRRGQRASRSTPPVVARHVDCSGDREGPRRARRSP